MYSFYFYSFHCWNALFHEMTKTKYPQNMFYSTNNNSNLMFSGLWLPNSSSFCFKGKKCKYQTLAR